MEFHRDEQGKGLPKPSPRERRLRHRRATGGHPPRSAPSRRDHPARRKPISQGQGARCCLPPGKSQQENARLEASPRPDSCEIPLPLPQDAAPPPKIQLQVWVPRGFLLWGHRAVTLKSQSTVCQPFPSYSLGNSLQVLPPSLPRPAERGQPRRRRQSENRLGQLSTSRLCSLPVPLVQRAECAQT